MNFEDDTTGTAGSLPVGERRKICRCRMECAHCGWNDEEAERRRHIPLKWCEDGMRRKILPPRPRTDELGN